MCALKQGYTCLAISMVCALSDASVLARAPVDGKPERVVSLSLRTDQLLLLLAGRSQIGSVSYLAEYPHLSHPAAAAEGVPNNRDTAEEALALEPDLILAGP